MVESLFTKLLLTYIIRLNNITVLLTGKTWYFQGLITSLATKGRVDGIGSVLNIARKPSLVEILYTHEIAIDK